MFVDGRHAAMLELGWGDDFTRGLYEKYLSNQAHTLAMSFHRTAENELYKNDSAGARVVAAFSLTFTRRALGAAALHMIELFPDIELKFDQIVLSALKSEYRRSDSPALLADRVHYLTKKSCVVDLAAAEQITCVRAATLHNIPAKSINFVGSHLSEVIVERPAQIQLGGNWIGSYFGRGMRLPKSS